MGISRDVTVRELAGLSGRRRLRTPDAAAYIGVGESTLEKWRCSGQGPVFERAGTRIVVYRIADLDTFLAARRVESTSENPVKLTAAQQAGSKLPSSNPKAKARQERHQKPELPPSTDCGKAA